MSEIPEQPTLRDRVVAEPDLHTALELIQAAPLAERAEAFTVLERRLSDELNRSDSFPPSAPAPRDPSPGNDPKPEDSPTL